MPESPAETVARHQEIEHLLIDNWVGAKRALLASLNEFRYWTVEEVEAVFAFLPLIEDRLLSPHGPHYRYAPIGLRRWGELAGKTALAGFASSAVVLASPFMASSSEGREKLAGAFKANFDMVASSFFVKPYLELVQEAAKQGKALCCNKWGHFRILDSGYAAISHVWAETMGLEFNDEKIEQDTRGLDFVHYSRIMSQATRCGFEWIWLDLLAIPKKSDDPTSLDFIRELKTSILNSLHHIYRSAEAVIIIDSMTLQLKSTNPLQTAAILCCGRWLTRIWTYQEIKLARKALIVTASGFVVFQTIVDTLRQAEAIDHNRWDSLLGTLSRLMPNLDIGTSLADIAFSSQNRSSTNDIDYARGFFAVLGLTWKTGWTYEEAILEIMKSQPRHAARIANLSGMRGLPEPYSWAPRYLVQLEGVCRDGYEASAAGLLGFWYTINVERVMKHGPNSNKTKLICDLDVLDRDGFVVEIQTTLPHTWSERLTTWIDEAKPYGRAKLLCADDPSIGVDALHVFLMVLQDLGDFSQVCDGNGVVAGTAVMNHGEVEGTKLKWWLR